MTYQVQQSERTYLGRAFDVRWDLVLLPDGRTTKLDVVEHSDAVTILPIDSDQQVWFVRQYRHPTGLELLELPAGTLEPGEDPKTCALREIQEEIGMGARSIQKIGEFYLSPGYSTEFMYIYLAKDLYPSHLPLDDDEFIQVEKYPFGKIPEMVITGQIRDSKTLAAFYLAGLNH